MTVRNKLDALREISVTHAPNEKYENFVNVHTEAAAKYVPTKLKAKHGRH